MFVVIFEVRPRREHWEAYLETAALLRPDIEQIDGFIDNDRYQSDLDEWRILSLSTWRDEKAVVRWRSHGRHHVLGQERGRSELFEDYRLRVGEVTSDTQVADGGDLPQSRFDQTEVGTARAVTITQLAGPSVDHMIAEGAAELVEQERYVSIYRPGHRLLLASWRSAEAAAAGSGAGAGGAERHRRVRLIREYGMRERREAPQYFPDVV